MRRNSGIIGPKQIIELTNAPGVHEIFDHYNCKVDNAWPMVKKAYLITGSNGSNLDENVNTTFTIRTEGFEDGDTVYYSIATVSGPALTGADFLSGSLTGSFTVDEYGIGSISITPTGDGVAENNTAKLQIRKDSTSGEIIGESATLTMTDGALNVQGQVVFTSFNTTLNTDVSYTVPNNVSQMSAVCVGGGGGGGGNNGTSGPGASGGGGGGLAYGTFSVTAGETLTIRVGSGGAAGGTNSNPTSGSDTLIKRGTTVLLQGSGGSAGVSNSSTAAGGSGGGSSGTEKDGGGTGGAGGQAQNNGAGSGGGGAAGYSGNGGNGDGNSITGSGGSGGGGAGGAAANSAASKNAEQNGGGVGLYGQGTNGSHGSTTPTQKMGSYNLSPATGDGRQTVATSLQSGTYGGGGGSIEDDTSSPGHAGGNGGVRIIWGAGRSYPSTNVADV